MSHAGFSNDLRFFEGLPQIIVRLVNDILPLPDRKSTIDRDTLTSQTTSLHAGQCWLIVNPLNHEHCKCRLVQIGADAECRLCIFRVVYIIYYYSILEYIEAAFENIHH